MSSVDNLQLAGTIVSLTAASYAPREVPPIQRP
jgi:hypothetical protein